MTPPRNTPLRMTLHNGDVVYGRYCSINDVLLMREPSVAFADEAIPEMNAPRWWADLNGELSLTIRPAAWCRLEDAHGTEPETIKRELARAKELNQ